MVITFMAITAEGLPGGSEPLKGTVRVHEDAPDDRAATKVIRAKISYNDMGLKSLPRMDENDKEDDAPFTLLWGLDVLIRDVDNGTPSGLVMDVADNGDIYVGILMKGPGTDDDTLEIWRSTDGGYSWSRIDYLKVVGEIDHNGIDLAVGPGSNPWLYVVVNRDDLSSIGQGIYFRRIRVDGSAYDWVTIVEEDTVERPRISVNNDGHIAITYVTNGTGVYRGISTDEGLTWSIGLASTGVTWSEIYISDNGRGYHAYVVANTTVRVVTFNAPSYSADDVTTLELPDTARHVSVTASGGAVSSQEAVVVWANKHIYTNVWDVHYSYSTDGGETWAAPDVFEPTNFPYPYGDYMNYPYVHRDRNASEFGFVVTFVSSWDTVFYAFASSANGWSTSLIPINDHNGATSFGAVIDYCPGTGGGCIVYGEQASYRVWFDGWNFTEVQEEPSQVGHGIVVVSGGIKTSSNVRVYSVDGRMVASGKGFIGLKRGVYLVRSAHGTVKVILR